MTGDFVIPKRSHLFALLACGLTVACSEAPADPAAGSVASKTVASAAGPVVANFSLKDETGAVHELYALKDKAAVVLTTHGNGCPIVQKLTPTLREITAAYGEQNVAFLMLNSNIQDTPEMIAAEVTEFDLGIPVLKDLDQAVGRALKVERTAEVFVINPKDWRIVFHGPVDDRLSYGGERPVADNNYLRETLEAVLAGQIPPYQSLPASGCIINFAT